MGFIDDDSLNMSGYGIGEIYVGMKKSVSKTITESDVYTYAGIIGDINPVHVNAEYAKTTRFGERIAHGMLAWAMVLGNPSKITPLLSLKLSSVLARISIINSSGSNWP